MKTRLDRIEARLQSFIEGSLTSLLPWGDTQRMLARQLVEAMQAQIEVDSSGSLIAPNLYTILISPSRLAYWESNPVYLEKLAHALEKAGQEADFSFNSPPVIRVNADDNLSVEEVRILAISHQNTIIQTSAMNAAPATSHDEEREITGNSFLIVDGVNIFPIQKSVTNIGRRADNHLVIDDARVSRSHAQLRVIKGRIVIFDLNSTGGTFINGERITRHTLFPGDVISIAGIPLIFGQDTPPKPPQDNNQSGSLPSGSTKKFSNQPDHSSRQDSR